MMIESHQPVSIRKRNLSGLNWKSEGFIVPLEEKDNITFPEGRNPALLMQPKSGGYGDCRNAINPFKYQDTTEEAVSQGQARAFLSLLLLI